MLLSVDPSSAAFTHARVLSAKQEALDIAEKSKVLLEMTKIIVRGDNLSESVITYYRSITFTHQAKFACRLTSTRTRFCAFCRQ